MFCKNCTNQVHVLTTGIESGDSDAGKLTINQRIGVVSIRSIGVRFGVAF